MLYFFLSYARGDGDVFVERFYEDLSTEVRLRAGSHSNERVGFLDAYSIELGEDWSNALNDALATSRAFVPLCSQRYFLDDLTGREWSVFAERLAAAKSSGEAPPAMIPVLWTPLRRVPDVVVPAFGSPSSAGADPSGLTPRDGLRQMMRLRRNRDEYLDILSTLADQIVAASDEPSVPPVPHHIDVASAPNAFSAATHSPTATSLSTDAQSVHFIVVSATRSELVDIREDLTFNGESPLDWRPYKPDLQQPLSEFACSVAAQRGLSASVAEVDELPDRIDWARRHNQIVVLLIDAWAMRLDSKRDQVSESGAGSDLAPQTAVLVPLSQGDPETTSQRHELSAAVRSVFSHLAADSNGVMFQPAIGSHWAFDEELQGVLEVARNRTFVSGIVYRPPIGATLTPRPVLQGP